MNAAAPQTTVSLPSPPDGQALAHTLSTRIRSVVAVEPDVLDPLLVALIAGGHALVEGIPGVGKTLLARTLARCVDASFHRIQFTNDLMPADVVGSVVWRRDAERFDFVAGPLFAQVVLADEINRTSPRTLSCLLEAMESGVVSVEGRTHALPEPFLVLATRNGIEFHGTFPIPEAALDRFLVRVALGYPTADRELGLLLGDRPEDTLAELRPILDPATLLACRQTARATHVSEPVARYCQRLVVATRQHDGIALGASPRAALALLQASRAFAFLDGRDHVLPDDLKKMLKPVLGHRLFAHGGRDVADGVLDEIRDGVAVEL